jgi:hypothetical protein
MRFMIGAMHPDSELIKRLGGVREVARVLGYGVGGIQRVHHWLRRGIPAKVKLERPDLFLDISALKKRAKSKHKRAEAPAYQGEERRNPSEVYVGAPRRRASDKPNNG